MFTLRGIAVCEKPVGTQRITGNFPLLAHQTIKLEGFNDFPSIFQNGQQE
jgi:hypothetical protein